MRSWNIQYLLTGRLLAALPFRQPVAPHSFAFCCSACGEIWGRVWNTDANYWQFESVACEQHTPAGVPDWGYTPGSFLWYHPQEAPSWARPRILGAMPTPVLQRELALHINAALRKEQDE